MAHAFAHEWPLEFYQIMMKLRELWEDGNDEVILEFMQSQIKLLWEMSPNLQRRFPRCWEWGYNLNKTLARGDGEQSSKRHSERSSSCSSSDGVG